MSDSCITGGHKKHPWKRDAHCPEVWKEIKARRDAGKEKDLLEEIRKLMQ